MISSVVLAIVAPLFLLRVAARTHCSNACSSAWNGVCDDERSCLLGSDCADCGAVHVPVDLEPPPSTYHIQHGDTLGRIGAEHGVMGLTLQFWNHIPDPTKLLKDQTIDVSYAQHRLRVAERERDLGEAYKQQARIARARALRNLFGKESFLGLVSGEFSSASHSQGQEQSEQHCTRPSVQSLLQLPSIGDEHNQRTAAESRSLAYDMSSPDNHIWWSPASCHKPPDTVAIIVPFRNRHAQLPAFLARMHPILRAQNLRFRIFVIEQGDDGPFNRGALLNIGAAEATALAPRDALLGALGDFGVSSSVGRQRLCYVFHDIDMLPVSSATPYWCPTAENPHHLSTTVDTFVYQCPYSEIMGGVTTFTPEQMVATNGYSNNYVEWGGEDDDMSFRVRHAAGRKILRPADCLVRKGACIFDPACQDSVGIIPGYENYDYETTKSRILGANDATSQPHPGSFVMNGGKTNEDKHSSADVYRSIFDSPIEFVSSGLSNLKYERLSVEHRPLYSLVRVRLPTLAK